MRVNEGGGYQWTEEEEEKEEGISKSFVFNDTIERPRAPAITPGRVREEKRLFITKRKGNIHWNVRVA
jgi:hypothetical protein